MEIRYHTLKEDGIFPNNGHLPVIVYLRVCVPGTEDPAMEFENIFRRNGWINAWHNGIYPEHHYHSTAHEVLGVTAGSATLILGGKNGIVTEIERGDAILIPAGVAHKKIISTSDFSVVGAYPEGQKWDMNYGHPGERPAVDKNISLVPLPVLDPVLGEPGPMIVRWISNT